MTRRRTKIAFRSDSYKQCRVYVRRTPSRRRSAQARSFSPESVSPRITSTIPSHAPSFHGRSAPRWQPCTGRRLWRWLPTAVEFLGTGIPRSRSSVSHRDRRDRKQTLAAPGVRRCSRGPGRAADSKRLVAFYCGERPLDANVCGRTGCRSRVHDSVIFHCGLTALTDNGKDGQDGLTALAGETRARRKRIHDRRTARREHLATVWPGRHAGVPRPSWCCSASSSSPASARQTVLSILPFRLAAVRPPMEMTESCIGKRRTQLLPQHVASRWRSPQ